MQEIALNSFAKTNQSLLDSDINTELSGSTVVAVFHYQDRLFCLNVGDSRAIICQQVSSGTASNSARQTLENKKTIKDIVKLQYRVSKADSQQENQAKFNLSRCKQIGEYVWKFKELSIDQKPERADQMQRILNNGGRIDYNKNQNGQNIGPLRVWMKDIQMPGLAMTRSFGDKAGLKAGTSSDAEVIQHILREDDKFMIIASDGVWEYLDNEDVMNLVVPQFCKNDLDGASEKIIKIATQVWSKISYSRDDISIIIVGLGKIINF